MHRSEYVTTAVIRGGKLKVSNPSYFIDALKTFRDGPVLVSVKAANKVTRSAESNRGYWGYDIRPLADHLGEDPYTVHCYCKARFLEPAHLVIADTNGEICDERDIPCPTTTILTPEEFRNYRARIKVLAAELGVEVGGR